YFSRPDPRSADPQDAKMADSRSSNPTILTDLVHVRAILDAIPVPIFIKDEQHRFVTLNHAMCALMGRDFAELVGRTDYDFVPKEQADVFLAHDQRVLDSGAMSENEEAFTGADGKPRIVMTRKKRIVLP